MTPKKVDYPIFLTSPRRLISGILNESPLVMRVNVPSFWLRTAAAAEEATAEGSAVMQQEARLNDASVQRGMLDHPVLVYTTFRAG